MERNYKKYDVLRESIRQVVSTEEIEPYDIFTSIRPTQFPNTENPSEMELKEWVASDAMVFMIEIILYALRESNPEVQSKVDIEIEPVGVVQATGDWAIKTRGTHSITIHSELEAVTCKLSNNTYTMYVNLCSMSGVVLSEVKADFDRMYRDILTHYSEGYAKEHADRKVIREVLSDIDSMFDSNMLFDEAITKLTYVRQKLSHHLYQMGQYDK